MIWYRPFISKNAFHKPLDRNPRYGLKCIVGIQYIFEEYEIYDEAFTPGDGKPYMFVRIQGTVYPEAVVDIRFEYYPEVKKEETVHKCAGLTKHPNNIFTI